MRLSRLAILNACLTVVLLVSIVVSLWPRISAFIGTPDLPASSTTTSTPTAYTATTLPIVTTPTTAVTAPIPTTPLEKFAVSRGLQRVSGDVVFVTKRESSGDWVVKLRGRIRNISSEPYKNVLVLWSFVDQKGAVFDVYYGGAWQKSVFLDVIEYLDAKAESDFNISVNLYSGVDAKASKEIRSAIRQDRHDVGLFVRAETR